MSDPEPERRMARTLRPPTQCVLWQKPELVAPLSERFEVLENFVESSHLDRALLKCRECGQLYFYEFNETIDWDGGDDAQHLTYIPVQTREEAEALKEASDLSLFSPRLKRDHPTGTKAETVRWIGK